MRAIDLTGGTDVIPTEDCLRLLRLHHVGRVGVVVDGQVEIFPVNYSFDGEVITFASNEGRKLHGVRIGEVTFEVDSFDEPARAGWSVVAHGLLQSLGQAEADDRAMTWTGRKDVIIRIHPEAVSGRLALASFWQAAST